MRKAECLGLVFVGCVLAAGPTLAKGPGGEGGGFRGLVMGGVGFTSDYEGSDAYGITPLAAAHLSWEGFYAHIAGPSVRLNVVPFDNFDFGPTLGYRGGRDDDVEDEKVKLLREVEDSLEVGFFAEYRFVNRADPRYKMSVGLKAAKDVNDGHDGSLVTASLGYNRPVFESFIWSLGTSVSYADDNYMNAYFDIDADNASRSGLARFDAEGGIKDVGLSTSLSHKLGESWNVAGRVSYTRLVGDAADSPVVDDRGSADQLFGGITVGYGF